MSKRRGSTIEIPACNLSGPEFLRELTSRIEASQSELKSETSNDLRIFDVVKDSQESMYLAYGDPEVAERDSEWFRFPTIPTLLHEREGPRIAPKTDGFCKHRAHKTIASDLENALFEIFQTIGEKRYIEEGWHIYAGCYMNRPKTAGSGLSIHAWGLGPDFNPNENWYSETETTFSNESIDIMEKHGFISGGRAWGKDWMHFQRAWPSHVTKGSYYHQNGIPPQFKLIR